MMHYQMRLPICKRCGQLHTHFLEYTFSALCQACHDYWIVDTFAVSAAAQRMTDAEALDYLRQRRPELFERGVLPDYLLAVRSNAKEITHDLRNGTY